jgi:putative Mn2+ efflux pump MntP
MVSLLLLGLVLSLDSFRVSLGLGTLRPRPAKQAQIVIAFGLCDGLAPLLGIAIGQSLTQFLSGWAEYIGPAFLALYGAFVVYSDRHWNDAGQGREPGGWIVFGLPLSLSLDNLIAGTSLGMKGFPLPLCVLVIGGCSSLAAFTGLRMGRMAGNYVPLDGEWIGGVALIAIAAVLAIEGG